ncbi:MAG TPA: hypothetical protein PKB10_01625 [Tepidisphaeraceae bacterium]|nr:hypothetical protein [Tepidisphaeraceae bacterium]
MMQKACFLLLVALGVAGTGCDRVPEPPPEAASPPEQRPDDADSPEHPTTQELLTGERVPLRVGIIPAELTVPASWKMRAVDTAGEFMVIEGRTPHDTVYIRSSSLMPIKPETYELYLNRLRQENSANTQLLKSDIRDQGGFKVIETITPNNAGAVPAVDWRLRLIAFNGVSYDQYEMNFIIPRASYEQDKPFLSAILDTIRYTGESFDAGGR